MIRGQPGQIHAELLPENFDADAIEEGVEGSIKMLFETSSGRLVSREEAQQIAKAVSQTNRPNSPTLHTSSLREPEKGAAVLRMLFGTGAAAGGALTAAGFAQRKP